MTTGPIVFGCCSSNQLTWRFVDNEPQLYCTSCGSVWCPSSPIMASVCPDPDLHKNGNTISNNTGWGCCSTPELEWRHLEKGYTSIYCQRCQSEWGSPPCDEPRDHDPGEYEERVREGVERARTDWEQPQGFSMDNPEFQQAVEEKARALLDQNEYFLARVNERVEAVLQEEGPAYAQSKSVAAPDTCTHYQEAWQRFDRLIEAKTTWGRTVLRGMMKDCLLHMEAEVESND